MLNEMRMKTGQTVLVLIALILMGATSCEKKWGYQIALEGERPVMVFESPGSALVVYRQSDALSLARAAYKKEWEKLGEVSEDEVDNNICGKHVAASDMSGNMMAAWIAIRETQGGQEYLVRSARYVHGSGMEQALTIESIKETYYENSLGLLSSQSGKAVAWWISSETVDGLYKYSVHYAQFDPSLGWAEPAIVEGLHTGGQLNAVKAAAVETKTSFTLLVTTMDISHSGHLNAIMLSDPANIRTANINGNGWCIKLKAAAYGDGTAIAVYQQYEPLDQRLYSRTFSESTGFGDEKIIAQETNGRTIEDFTGPVWDGVSDIHLCWINSDTSTEDKFRRIYTSRYDGIGWLIPFDITSGSYMRSPGLASDRKGNLMAVYSTFRGGNTWSTPSVNARSYTQKDGWGGNNEIYSTSDDKYALSSQIVMDGSGNAIAVWEDTGVMFAKFWK